MLLATADHVIGIVNVNSVVQVKAKTSSNLDQPVKYLIMVI